MESFKPVCIGLDRRIYFENHQQCYFLGGKNGQPRNLYTLLDSHLSAHIGSVILYHGVMQRYPCTPEEQCVCLLMLTTDGHLKVLNADTGQVLRTVYLSSTIKYRYLSWANYLHTVQVKSIVNPRPLQWRDGQYVREDSILMTIAVFKIQPLELVANVPIDRKVFGQDIRDAIVHEDLLQIVHSSKFHRFYSLTWIVQNCTVVHPEIGTRVTMEGGVVGIIGQEGFGIPITVNIEECPPVMFAVKSTVEVGVTFGGSPTLYIHSQPGMNIFSVVSLRTGNQIGQVCADRSDESSFHKDIAEFHFDDYQKILYITGTTLRCYSISHDYDSPQSLVTLYNTDFKQLHTQEEQTLVTQYGRVVKRRKPPPDTYDDFSSAIQDVDYENEIDLLHVVVTLPEGQDGTQAKLCFIDEPTGKVVKEVLLPTWEPDEDNSIYYELDCIVHIVHNSNKSVCHYYRLVRQ